MSLRQCALSVLAFAIALGLAATTGATQGKAAKPASPLAGVTLADRCEIDPGNPSSPPGGWDRNRKTGRVILTMHGTAPGGAKLRIAGSAGPVLLVPFVSGGDSPAIGYPAAITLLGASGQPLPAKLNGQRFQPARGYHARFAFTLLEMNGLKCRELIGPRDMSEPPFDPNTKAGRDAQKYYGVDELGRPMVRSAVQ